MNPQDIPKEIYNLLFDYIEWCKKNPYKDYNGTNISLRQRAPTLEGFCIWIKSNATNQNGYR